MDTYFTIMVKENDTSTLKLLTEKLTEGFYINDRIEVGRSTVLTLRKQGERSEIDTYLAEASMTSLPTLSSGSNRY